MNAAIARNRFRTSEAKRLRELVTPEGLSLPLTIASRGARAGALMLDLLFIGLGFFALMLFLISIGFGMLDFNSSSNQNSALEFVVVLLIMLFWFSRYGYFLYFELGPKGATPGKRLLGIRVAARDGGRLTPEAVIARNLMRDVEVFLPIFFLLGGAQEAGIAGSAATVWLAIFILFPFLNKDRLRAGDLVAGTWVVEAPKVKLPEAMSLAPDRREDYQFGEAELSVYGEHELQVLESVLRQDNDDALHEVTQAICRKIGWTPGSGHDREFLEAFYSALRAHLERGMRFGKRKADKHDAS